jgi:hypothetical protein
MMRMGGLLKLRVTWNRLKTGVPDSLGSDNFGRCGFVKISRILLIFRISC